MGSRAARRAAVVHRVPAFSLVEILVVIGLLSVILLGLMLMFDQTQRAFRTGMTQTDVLETGRMATDLIVREMEQVTPAYLSPMGQLLNGTTNIQPNFYAWLSGYAPLVQPLPGSRFPRTNLLEELFFLIRRNQEWIGIGYFVRTNDPSTGLLGWPLVSAPQTTVVGAGTLYRFETNAAPLSGRTPAQLFQEFLAAQVNETNLNVSKIADGVIHFRVRAYDTNGFYLTSDLTNNCPPAPVDCTACTNRLKSCIEESTSVPGEVGLYVFKSNAVPAAVELEIGILEDRAWKRYTSLPDAASQYRYLTNQAGRVHLFRQLIPIRNVDPLAYQ